MNKSVLKTAYILCFSYSLFVHAEPQEVFARSFMFTRPASFYIAMNQQMWHNFVYNKKGSWGGAFQFIPYAQASRPREKVARYFLPNRRNELCVAGDNTSAELVRDRDIRAEWLGLASDFSGKFSICPSQKQIGFTLMYNQDVGKMFDFEPLNGWGIGIEVPITLVENNLNLRQFDMHTTTTELGVQPDIISALNQCSWCYGKWAPCKKSLIRPEKIKLTAGRSLMHRDYFQLASEMSLTFPTAPHQDPQYLFAPMVGLDKHVGLGAAAYLQILLNRNPSRLAWTLYANLEGTFLIRNRSYRTYDLKNKPFSRYMLFTKRNSAPGEVVPGVNVLTLQSEVRPFGFFDFSFGWRINVKVFEFEIGYDLYGNGGEYVRPRNPVESPFNTGCSGGLNDFGIAGNGSIVFKDTTIQATANESTISCQAPNDPTFISIEENDLDLCTAAAGSILNHKFHAAVGILQDGDHGGCFAGLGFFFEFPQKNSNLANYGGWFKIGGSF